MRKKSFFYFFVILFFLGGEILFAQEVPTRISFQGRLMENGTLVDTTKDITFSINDWSETHNVPISAGIYSVILGSLNPIPDTLFTLNSSAILHISIEGVELQPNTEILTSPYAFKSESSAKLNGETPEYYLASLKKFSWSPDQRRSCPQHRSSLSRAGLISKKFNKRRLSTIILEV